MRPTLSPVDFVVIAGYVVFALAVGGWFARFAKRGVESFFVGDRRLPWWLAGTSMVATTFAADTPLAVTGIVAADGISGNWIWWSWAIAHLTATFFFARLWRRSGVITDAEITELRYSGRGAALLRGVKAIYFGIFVNCLTMAWVIAAMIKIARAFFDVEPVWVVAACVAVSVAYTLMGGFRSVVVTDLVQFALGMGGAILLAVLVAQSFGGIGQAPDDAVGSAGSGLLGALGTAVEDAGDRSLGDVLGLLPPADHPTLPPIYFLVLLLAGWWRYAEGTGYLVQRFAACRDEAHAQGASLWFAVAHNALRPWPWILVGLAALVIYPRLPGDVPQRLTAPSAQGEAGSLSVTPARLDVATGGTLEIRGLPPACTHAVVGGQEVPLEPVPAGGPGSEGAVRVRFGSFAASGIYDLRLRCAAGETVVPGLSVELTDREMAYPLILGRTLPPGLLGLVVASLLAAFMSTIDTHTNWGASYLVQDVYRRFFRPQAPPEHYVAVSRGAIVLIAVLAGITALFIGNIAAVWRFLITLGAGLGSVAAARWYWARVTPHAEFAALGVTTAVALTLELLDAATLLGVANPLFVGAIAPWSKILLVAGSSLAAWVTVALVGPRNPEETLRAYARKVRPAGSSFRPYLETPADPLGPVVLRFLGGIVVVFAPLAGIGDLLLGHPLRGLLSLALGAVVLAWILRPGSSPAPGSSSSP